MVVNKVQDKTAGYFNYYGDYAHIITASGTEKNQPVAENVVTHSHNNSFSQLSLDKTFLGHAV